MKREGTGKSKLRNTWLLGRLVSGFAVISFLFIVNSGAVVKGQSIEELQGEVQALKQHLQSLEAKLEAERVKPPAPPEEEIKKLVQRVEVLEIEKAKPPVGAERADVKAIVDELWADYQKKREKEKLFTFTLHGLAKNWALSQNKFRFGKDQIRDNYIVSIFRILPEISTLGGDVKFVGRFDIAQGWWGVDNDRGTFIDWQGDNRSSSNLFSNKDTNYAFHADWTYIDLRLPFIPNDYLTRAQFGRMFFGVGNKLILDYDYDGIQTITKHGPHTTTLGWAKVWEGYAGLSDREAKDRKWDGLSMGLVNGVSGEDANLWMVKHEYVLPQKRGRVEGYYLYYNDSGTDDGAAYLYDEIDYSNARFRPQIGQLNVLGGAGDVKVGKFSIQAEAAGLYGRDHNDNDTFNSSGIPDGANADSFDNRGNTRQSPGTTGNAFTGATAIPGYLPPHFFNRLDKNTNNGEIWGWTAYLNTKYNDAFNVGKPGLKHVTPGLVVGLGSGDKDPTRGSGNINKIQTEGWFYVSEVWEDSIMPDLTGITPQGLGAPWSRGYREFENQILVQPNFTWKFHPKWELFGAYEHVWAMHKVYAWAPEGRRIEGTGIGGADFRSEYLITDGRGHTPGATNPYDTTHPNYDPTKGFDPNGFDAQGTGNNTQPGVLVPLKKGLFERGGIDKSRGAIEIGDEVDWNLTYHIFSNLDLELRGGIFWPGDAASYLIGGAKGWDSPAWEGRWDITFKF